MTMMLWKVVLPPTIINTIPARGSICIFFWTRCVCVYCPLTMPRRARKAVSRSCFPRHLVTIVTHSRDNIRQSPLSLASVLSSNNIPIPTNILYNNEYQFVQINIYRAFTIDTCI